MFTLFVVELPNLALPTSIRWPSITVEWEMDITAQGPRLRNDLYCVEWDVNITLHYRFLKVA